MKSLVAMGALVVALLGLSHHGLAQQAADVAVVLKTKGKVDVTRVQNRPAEIAKQGTRLHNGNLLHTGDESLAALVFTDDKSLLKVRSNSKVAIKGMRQQNSIVKTIAMEFGQLWAKVTKSAAPFRVQTPSGVAAVKGTNFYCITDEAGKMIIICLEGAVELANALGKVLVNAGYTGTLEKDQPPTVRPSRPDEIPSWGEDDSIGGSFEIEFEDARGQKKKLKINYD